MDTCKALAVPVVIFGLIVGYLFALDFALNFFRANPTSLAFVGAAVAVVVIIKHKSLRSYLHELS